MNRSQEGDNKGINGLNVRKVNRSKEGEQESGR